MNAPIFIAGILFLNIVVSEWLVRKTFCRHFGTALLVIVVTAIVANLGLIPSSQQAPPLYSGIFNYIAPLSIFFLLLEVNLRNLKRAGPSMLLMFIIGAAGTMLGVLLGMWAIGGRAGLGEQFHAVAGMFTGTYTGGSVNFNALALHYGVNEDGNLYAGSVAVDNIMTTLWMIATILLPKALNRWRPRRITPPPTSEEKSDEAEGFGTDTEKFGPMALGLCLALGAFAMWISDAFAAWLASKGLAVPSILILTTIGILLAQIPAIQKLRGKRALAMFSVYLFLAVIGAFCDFATLADIGSLGISLMLFAGILVLVHGSLTFGLGALLRRDWDLVAVASQANIGGSTSALALAKSLDRTDLTLPAILVGSLGNGLGTYLGFLVAMSLQSG